MVREICSRCDEFPENILVLECGHKICIGCGSALLNCLKYTIRCNLCA